MVKREQTSGCCCRLQPLGFEMWNQCHLEVVELSINVNDLQLGCEK